MNIVTLHEVSKVMERKLNITAEEAKKIAIFLLDMFGFEDRIIDNGLDQKERQLFYRLESEGILGTAREEIILHNGQTWRIHYWILQKSAILKCVNGKDKMGEIVKKKQHPEPYPDQNIYSYLSKDAWTSKKLPAG